ncbi:MAG: hypothetical protein LBE01_06245, partial [Deltaproteobacteria bacterium]|nr:hypothetical protein [Deltaproteobacteria bacterium]
SRLSRLSLAFLWLSLAFPGYLAYPWLSRLFPAIQGFPRLRGERSLWAGRLKIFKAGPLAPPALSSVA